MAMDPMATPMLNAVCTDCPWMARGCGLCESRQEDSVASAAAAHDGHLARPRVPVDRDGHRRPLASTERPHNLRRNHQASHGLGRLDVRPTLHDLLLPTTEAVALTVAAAQ